MVRNSPHSAHATHELGNCSPPGVVGCHTPEVLLPVWRLFSGFTPHESDYGRIRRSEYSPLRGKPVSWQLLPAETLTPLIALETSCCSSWWMCLRQTFHTYSPAFVDVAVKPCWSGVKLITDGKPGSWFRPCRGVLRRCAVFFQSWFSQHEYVLPKTFCFFVPALPWIHCARFIWFCVFMC